MFSGKRHSSRHVADDILVQYLDDELPSSQMAEVRAHLASCWSCRGRASELKQSIRLFMQYRKAAIHELGRPPHQFGEFRTRLRQQAVQFEELAARRELPEPPAWMVWVGAALRHLTIPRAATAAVTSVALAWWFLFSGASVSAQAVLRYAVQSESEKLHSFGQPVVHQRLRVSTGDRQGTWEIWRAPKEKKISQHWTGGGDLSSELSSVLAANHFDPQQPLSAASFAAWRDSLGDKRENVQTDEQAHVVVISTESALARSGEIQHAVFTVRDSDWHPISQTFDVRTKSGAALRYRVEETSYAVLPIEQVAADVFTTPQPDALVLAASHVGTREPVREAAAPAGIGEEQLAESEVLLREVLHETGADVREAPEVLRTPGHVELSLWTDDAERKQEILASIDRIPAVVTHVNEFGGTVAPVAAAAASPPVAAVTYATEPPLAKALKEYSGSTQAAANYLAAVSDAAQELRVETSALSRLATAYPDQRWNALPARLREKLDRIASDHSALIHQRAATYVAMLSPALDAMAAREGLSPATNENSKQPGAWRNVAPELNDALPRVQTPFRRLFMEDHLESPVGLLSAHDLLSEALTARAHFRAVLDRLRTP